MLSNVAISVNNVSKVFCVYEKAIDRLKQPLINRFRRISGKKPIALHKNFHALKDISFNVRKGETIGIVGRNGSGKSTILQIITGILTPSHGDVDVSGRIAALLELGSGFNFEFTGRENIYLNASILGLSKKEIDEKYEDIIAFADIGSFIDEPVKTYSSGMMVRLAFAVAINIEPDILIVDEALAVGDELFQRKCFSKIEEIKSKGATILFVSHSGPTIVELCDRAVLIDSGELLMVGSAKDVISSYHKLIYSPADEKDDVIEEIKKPCKITPKVSNFKENTIIGDFFDPNLKPSNTVVYKSHGATIKNARLTTLENGPVNNLTRGGVYKYQYSVLFDEDIESVRCGMLIKTIKGIELGGAITSTTKNAIKNINKKQEIEVEFIFECNLNPDVYFLNSGVLGIVNGYETYIHRLIDASMFKVIPETNLTSTCIVDFKCQSKVEVLS